MANRKDVVSIVVPVYKVDAFLDKCIASIVAQTYEQLDIILVDDGSPDESPFICDKWGRKDKRIRVVHKKNEGVSKARLTGLNLAAGQWIFFVDADDLLPPNAIEVLLSASMDCDIVVGQVSFNGPYRWPYPPIETVVSRRQYLSMLLGHYKLHGGPVAKLFKKELFSEWTFDVSPKIVCGEDFIMNLRIAQRIKKANIIKDVVYFYEYRGDSALSKQPFDSFAYVILFERYLLASFEKKNFFVLLPNIVVNAFCQFLAFVKKNLKKLF